MMVRMKILRTSLPTAAIWSALLVLASTGGAVASQQLTGAQVRNGSLTGADIRGSSLQMSDLSPRVRESLVAPRIVTENVKVPVNLAGTEHTIRCPSGTIATSGGLSGDPYTIGAAIVGGHPNDEGWTTWIYASMTGSEPDAVSVPVYAVCA